MGISDEIFNENVFFPWGKHIELYGKNTIFGFWHLIPPRKSVLIFYQENRGFRNFIILSNLGFSWHVAKF